MANANNKSTDYLGRRTRDPLPNILRIETLSKNALKEYVTIYGDISQDIQHKLRTEVGISNDLLFYGFMQNDSLSVNMTANWSQGESKTILDKAADVIGPSNSANPSGADRLKTSISSFLGLGAKALTPNVTRLLGANATATGSTTQKHFESISISGGSIKCGWYLPQSLKQAVIGLKTLTEMAYPQSISDKRKNTVPGESETTLDTIKDGISALGGQVSDVFSTDQDTFKKLNELAAKQLANADFAQIGEDFLGVNITFDPRPVRISIGNKAVLEPMVLTNLNIRFSKESFLKTYSDGTKKMLPEFVMVEIGYDYWLIPGPLKNKMKLLGLPMFSKSTDTQFMRSSLENDEEFKRVFNDKSR